MKRVTPAANYPGSDSWTAAVINASVRGRNAFKSLPWGGGEFRASANLTRVPLEAGWTGFSG
jgi:hypothetical protein